MPIAVTTSTETTAQPASGHRERMPWLALAVLASMGFILLTGETLPAGLLPAIASGMHTSEGLVGQYISLWALGTVIVTVPAISLTRALPRKPLLVIAVAGFILANTVTAFSADIPLSLVARFIGGAFTGVIWGMLAAYGRRISPPSRGGLSLSIVSIGAPLGFALGTPAGSYLGTAFDWRWSFIALSAAAVIVLVLIVTVVPGAPGQKPEAHLPLRRIIRLPGIPIVLLVIFVWMLGHNTIYTYIAPFLRAGGSGLAPAFVLLVFGIASIVGVAITGALVDRHPRALLHTSIALFSCAAIILLVGHASSGAVIGAAVVWGATFGGAAPQLQSALTIAGGEHSDVANSFLPVAFNLAIFAAGTSGALLLEAFPPLILAAWMATFGAIAFALTCEPRRRRESRSPRTGL
jgi:predicted MFS family arabinose efflux permease